MIGRGGPVAKDRAFFKFYLNVEPEILEALVGELFALPSPLRFELKAPNHPDDYGCRDAAVLYSEAPDRLALSEVLFRLHRSGPTRGEVERRHSPVGSSAGWRSRSHRARPERLCIAAMARSARRV